MYSLCLRWAHSLHTCLGPSGSHKISVGAGEKAEERDSNENIREEPSDMSNGEGVGSALRRMDDIIIGSHPLQQA